jgi:hypothetical protein
MVSVTAPSPTCVIMRRNKLGCVGGAWRHMHAVSKEYIEQVAM